MNEDERFPALVAREDDEGRFALRLEERRVADLPAGELLIRVDYSSLNFKDALSAEGNRGVTKRYPHTPGIDAAGQVVASSVSAYSPGDEVVVTGFDLGMNTPGGWGRYIRVPAAWALPLPRGLSVREAMGIGTAGLTAALAVTRLLAATRASGGEAAGAKDAGGAPAHPSAASAGFGAAPGAGTSQLPFVVSGASGGVGSFAVALLAVTGRTVVAVSGKPDAAAYLRELGAAEVVGRDEVTDRSERLLLSARWSGGVDTVGGPILSTLLRQTAPLGAVAACGNAMEARFDANVYPFILRAVSLLGIDAASCPRELRVALWTRLAGDWREAWKRVRMTDCTLADLPAQVALMRSGHLLGRVVVDLAS